MDGITWNYAYKLPMLMEPLLLRSAYLLTDRTIATGTTRQHYHHFNTDLPVNLKLKMLESYFDNSVELEYITKSLDLLKRVKKMKHPPPKMIAMTRKLENSLVAMHDTHVNWLKEILGKTGSTHLDELVNYGYFDWYNHREDDYLEVPGEKHIAVHEVMTLLYEREADRHFSFFLPHILFKNEPGDAAMDLSVSANETAPGMAYAFPAFELPNLMMFSQHELHNIKMQLQPLAAPYQLRANEWIECCKESNDTAGCRSFFKKEVLPAALLFNEALAANQLLWQHHHNGEENITCKISLGEISLGAAWQLFDEFEMRPGSEEWETLLRVRDQLPFTMPLPAAVMYTNTDHLKRSAGTKNQSLKKSIHID